MPTAPEPLSTSHPISYFDSGVPSLDEWLRRRAVQNQISSASRTFVTCSDGKVVGYYALASSAVIPAAAPGRFRRNMPDPIPVVVLARLAVDLTEQGKGLGHALFKDASKRVIYAAETIGIRGLLVHALSEDGKAFYVTLGLEVSPLDPMTLMVTITDLQSALNN